VLFVAYREIEADRQGKTLEQLEKELGIVREDEPAKPGEKRREAAEAAAAAGLWKKVRQFKILLIEHAVDPV
jgi:hypothetical protein